MAWTSWRTLVWLPRRRFWRVRMLDQGSTRFPRAGALGREVQAAPPVAPEPALDPGRRLGRGVVDHQVKLARGKLPVEPTQEGQEFGAPMARAALAQHLPAGHIQGAYRLVV